MRKAFIWLLALTWELPQTILALLFMLLFKTKKLDKNGRIRRIHDNRYLTCFSLGEFIFFGRKYTDYPSWERTQKHEFGHSIQSRILGPLYLPLIAIPSVICNMLSRMDNRTGKWFYRHYYDTPWEHGADLLGKVKRQ